MDVRWCQAWRTPLLKQCFVTLGQCVALSQFGLVMGFTASLLPQLRASDSIIPIDEDTGSWIVCTPYIVAFFTSVFTPILMGKLGRKPASIISLILITCSWLLVTVATSLPYIILARALQGFSLGIIYCVSPIFIGESTSPKNRGVFLTFLSLSLSTGTLAAHLLGSYMSWQKRSFICSIVAFANLLIVLHCPETPSWLIDKGRYDEGKKAFFWLRGKEDDDELKKMIEGDVLTKEAKEDENKVTSKNLTYLRYMKASVKKPEFYKPIIIMMNLNLVMLYSGVNILAAYADDIYRIILGDGVDIRMAIATADIQRLITNIFSLYLIKKFKRRTMLICLVSLNALAYVLIAGYIYGKSLGSFPEKAAIGMLLIHFLMFTVASGSVPLPLIISGEIFPLEYRSLASVLSTATNCPLAFFVLKTYPFSTEMLGLHGTFCIYALTLEVCLIIAWVMLPETKGRTLQEIENVFRGRTKENCKHTGQSLTKLNPNTTGSH